MNDGFETAAETPSHARGCVGKQLFAILAAAIVLGLIYNVASPLGVRAPKVESQPVHPITKPINKTNPPVSASANFTNTSHTPTPSSVSSATVLRWADVKPLIEAGQVVLVDGRAKAAYDVEHIPGAVSLPAEGTTEEFMAFALKYPKDTAVVTYCGSDNCDLSHELAEKLRNELGFTNVKEMPGGFAEYRAAESQAPK